MRQFGLQRDQGQDLICKIWNDSEEPKDSRPVNVLDIF
jgi:hypothetical protein